MGVLPSTGQEISIGKINRALGLSASYPPDGGSNIRLNGCLGAKRNCAVTSISSIGAGVCTRESCDFGGLDTPQNYP
jgi:hypothetical protein